MLGVRKVYRELVKSVRWMQQENDRLKAENARLRSELESVGVAAYLYGRGDLLAENAKLRELVRNFLYEHEDYFAEGNYFIGDIDLEHAMQHNHAVFRHEARELGVEVE